MQLAHNEGYVIASYLLTLVAMIVIIGWVLLDSRGRQKELQKLEAAGIRRRSAAAHPAADQQATGQTDTGQTATGKTRDA